MGSSRIGVVTLALASLFAMGLSGAALGDDDVATGKKVFNKCKTCHEVTAEKNKIGPHLVKIIGRAAGSVADFKYSDAMKNSGKTWDEATLDAYLADPRGFIPGNKMTFPGLPKEDDREAVIKYLKSLNP